MSDGIGWESSAKYYIEDSFLNELRALRGRKLMLSEIITRLIDVRAVMAHQRRFVGQWCAERPLSGRGSLWPTGY